MPLPNFFIIGAAKSGTTSLHAYLRQHPDVFLSDHKEPHYYAFQGVAPDFRNCVEKSYWVWEYDEYLRLFDPAAGKTAVGEASALYLWFGERVADAIRRDVPDARIIVLLRQPADRAYSNYIDRVQNGDDDAPTFRAALEREAERADAGWHPFYRDRELGYYAKQLRPYLNRFDRDRLRVFLYDDLKSDPEGVVRDTFRFLGVDADVPLDLSSRYKVSAFPRHRRAHQFLTTVNPVKSAIKALVPASLGRQAANLIRRRNLGAPPPLDPVLRGELTEGYRDDILELQSLIGRDLSAWLVY